MSSYTTYQGEGEGFSRTLCRPTKRLTKNNNKKSKMDKYCVWFRQIKVGDVFGRYRGYQ